MQTYYYYQVNTRNECIIATTELTEVLNNAIQIQHKRRIRITLELPKCQQIAIILAESNECLVQLNDHFPFIQENANISKIRELIRDVVDADTEFKLGVAWGKFIAR